MSMREVLRFFGALDGRLEKNLYLSCPPGSAKHPPGSRMHWSADFVDLLSLDSLEA